MELRSRSLHGKHLPIHVISPVPILDALGGGLMIDPVSGRLRNYVRKEPGLGSVCLGGVNRHFPFFSVLEIKLGDSDIR